MFNGQFFNGLSIATDNPMMIKDGAVRLDIPKSETVRHLMMGWSFWKRNV